MSGDRRWYREPEMFIALAALIVSVSAVAVGIYEAGLQRAHDRAEVWPHVEVGTFTTPTDATLYIENTSVGPAVISSIVFTLDGKPRDGWDDLVPAWLEKGAPSHFSRSTVHDHSLRAGDKVVVLDLPMNTIPTGFWDYIHRVGVQVCYRSVFDDYWVMSQLQLAAAKRSGALSLGVPRRQGRRISSDPRFREARRGRSRPCPSVRCPCPSVIR